MSTDEYLGDSTFEDGETGDRSESYTENRKRTKYIMRDEIYMKPYLKKLKEVREDMVLKEHFKEEADHWKEILNEARKLEEMKRHKGQGQNNEQTQQGNKKLSSKRRKKRVSENNTAVKHDVKALPGPNNMEEKRFPSKRPKTVREILKIKKKFVSHPIENDIVPRRDWDTKARRQKTDETAKYIYYQRVHHIKYTDTGSQNICYDEDECEHELEKLTYWDEEKKESIITYNFLIGGDGKVYEGKGWPLLSTTLNSNKEELTGELDEDYSLIEEKGKFQIAFIGQFRDKRLPPNMFWAAHEFVNYGIKIKRISRGFTYTPLKVGVDRGAWDIPS